MNIYLSSSIKKNIINAVDMANELDVNIEICKFAESEVLDVTLDSVLKEYSSAFSNYSGTLSLHGAFFDLNPVSKDSKIRELSIYRYNQSFEIAKALDIKTVVFHTGYNGLVKAAAYHDKFIVDQIAFWTEFIKRFEDADIKVALENTYEQTPEVILSILSNVKSKYLRSCIDTGHVNINSDLSVIDWISELKDYLHHMHFHNNYGQYDEHSSILNGSLDFKKIINFLMTQNLNPNLIIEIFSDKAAYESIKYVQDICKLNYNK